jgi:hypothetical protein
VPIFSTIAENPVFDLGGRATDVSGASFGFLGMASNPFLLDLNRFTSTMYGDSPIYYKSENRV